MHRVIKNLYAELPGHLTEERVQVLAENRIVRIEQILSTGQASPEGLWYDQDRDEWVVVLRGAARLQFEDGIVALQAGDALNIPAHCRHRVEWTTPHEPTVWLAVHYSDGESEGTVRK